MVSTLMPQDEQDTKKAQDQSPSAAELQQQFDIPAFEDEQTQKKPSIMEGIKNSMRSRVDRVMGVFSPIPRAYQRVSEMGSTFRRGVQKVVNFFTGRDKTPTSQELKEQFDLPSHETDQEQEKASVYSDKEENVAKAYEAADAAEQEHMDDLADRFHLLQNNYRKQLSHENPDLKMKQPVLQIDPKLMEEAAIISQKQAAQGFLAHTSDEYRQQRNIHSEVLFSEDDEDFPYEALKGYLASDDHRPSVCGDFFHVGYAIRSGIEGKSGRKIYYLTVIYSGGVAQDAPIIEIPDQKRQLKSLEANNLDEAVKDRPYLKAYLDALSADLKSDPDLSLEFEVELSKRMQDKEGLEGGFIISLGKGEKKLQYSVSDRPPLLRPFQQKGSKSDRQIEFRDLIQDFENMNNAPAMTEKELQDSYDSESKDSILKRPDNFGEKLDKIRLIIERMPEEYEDSVSQIRKMSQGDDLDGLRKKHYEGWKDEHFQDLLNQLTKNG
jgi:uncharacterized protein YkwD